MASIEIQSEAIDALMAPFASDTAPSLVVGIAAQEAQASATIVTINGSLRLETRSRYGGMAYHLRKTGADLWSVASIGARVPFGAIIELDGGDFRFSTRRARRFKFERRR